jgi:hypothetical protein
MNEKEPQIKVVHVKGLSGVHVWYSEVDKAVLIRLDTTRWDVEVEHEGNHYHIYKKE